MRFIKFQSQVERCGTHYARANSRNSTSWYSPLARAPSQTSARLACSFLYPFQRLRKRKLNGVVLTTLMPIQETRHYVCAVLYAGIAVIAFCKGYRSSWYSPLARATEQTSARFACSFLYPFQRLRERKLNGYKKLSAHYVCTQRSLWSE